MLVVLLVALRFSSSFAFAGTCSSRMSLLVLTSEGNGTDGDGGASRATLAVVAAVVSSISILSVIFGNAPYNRSFASHRVVLILTWTLLLVARFTAVPSAAWGEASISRRARLVCSSGIVTQTAK